MYIENKYWNNYIGDTDDSLNLIAFLEDQAGNTISFSEILKQLGLHKQGENFRKTVSPLGFTNSIGIYVDFHFAIDVLTDLAAILLECKVSGDVDLHDLEPFDTASHRIKIIAAPEDYELLDRVLSDFSSNPLAYDICELVPQEDILEMAEICESLRQELIS
jgi:hypothetical protein|nr:imm68 putative immunity domain-containing protein [uncultured Oribacterium sp.]